MAFRFRLETVDGRPAEPARLTVAVPKMRSGDTIPLGPRTLRVVAVRDDDAEQPCLVGRARCLFSAQTCETGTLAAEVGGSSSAPL